MTWIEFCLVFHDDVQEGSEGFPCTKKEALFPAFAQGGVALFIYFLESFVYVLVTVAEYFKF